MSAPGREGEGREGEGRAGDGRAGEEGFLLVEVLVAFAILALVSLAMIRAFGGTIQTIGVTTAREAELDLAQAMLDLARAEGAASPGRQEGAEGALRWRRETTPVDGAGLPPPPGAPRLFRVEIGVWREGEAWPPLRLTSLIRSRRAGD